MTPVAVAIVWGLAFATLLTLFLIPSIYAILDDIARLFGRTRFQDAEKS
jgi:Cu/Ag efflux pump CusA